MQHFKIYSNYAKAIALMFLLVGNTSLLYAASPSLAITSAVFNKKSNALVVKASNKGGVSGEITLLHGEGGLLASQAINGAKQTFTIPLAQMAQVPCSVEVRAGELRAAKAVTGAPADCSKQPICKIISPKPTNGRFVAPLGTAVNFEGKVTLKDKKAAPITVEWDFAGGVMGHPNTNKTSATFVRGDSTYRVRFTAFDARKRYCEAVVEVKVGTPPSGLPPKVSEQAAAQRGSELAGTPDDVVVIPFEEWTYQNVSDMSLLPNGYSSFSPVVNSVKAYAFRKALKPVFLGASDVELRYSAASNPFDPTGSNSINSTSRNWPLDKAYTEAAVQKTDMWEIPNRPNSQKSAAYFACSWAMTGYFGAYGCGDSEGLPTADEGYFKPKDDPNNTDHGLFMPGKESAYQSNSAQAFSAFEPTEKAQAPNVADKPLAWFTATMLPITDIDDQGRVNPFPLLRVEAVQKSTNTVVAKTDGVLSAGKDFHCRECHAKGQVAANANAPYTKAAFASSAWGKDAVARAKKVGSGRYFIPDDKIPQRPEFFSVSDIGGDVNSIQDQEYAAALNYSSTHQFYDVIAFLNEMKYGVSRIYLTDDDKANPKNIEKDTPRPCYGCHATAISFTPFDNAWWDEEGFKVNDPIYAPNYSISMHRFHGELQWKDDAKTDIVRDDKGAFKRWDWKTKGPNNSTTTRSLFPIFDGQGKQLPMEENCLKCHNGHREQLYRDRMYTAGVSCFDCHGDMLAVGEAFPKNYLTNKAKLGSYERDDYRVAWFDEPDCGSCHVGDGNKGKTKANGYFSEGVMTTAFDLADWSATTRAIDKNDANSARFAVAPVANYKAAFPTLFYYGDESAPGEFFDKMVDTKVDAPVFRFGKDRHGNVACAACHGAAHAVWPNRDPKANDNVTSLQLQGHTGTILECNVCHSADAFKAKDDLDGGLTYSGDDKPGILGGPHNMHPVNDPYWWKEAPGDNVDSTPNSPRRNDGIIKGGWHNDYAKLSGKNGEDQCAACHGQDHKGTRLSKTPVDRNFIDEKGKPKSVKAGTPIACDLCHSLEKSFPAKLTSG